jgi:hypothetical protein
MKHACDGRQLLFDEATSWLLGRFVSAIQPVAPLVSVAAIAWQGSWMMLRACTSHGRTRN